MGLRLLYYLLGHLLYAKSFLQVNFVVSNCLSI